MATLLPWYYRIHGKQLGLPDIGDETWYLSVQPTVAADFITFSIHIDGDRVYSPQDERRPEEPGPQLLLF